MVNGQALCIKGRFGWDFVHNEASHHSADQKDGEFVEASWDEALDLIALVLKKSKKRVGPGFCLSEFGSLH